MKTKNDINKTNLVLNSCYPNPFSEYTNIEFTIPNSEHVRLEIVDTSGKQVALIVNDNKSAGTYNYKFENNGLQSGFYFSKIIFDNEKQTSKLLTIAK